MTNDRGALVLMVSGPVVGGIRAHLRHLDRHLPSHGYQARWATPAPIVPEGTGTHWRRLPLTERAASALSPGVVAGLVTARRRWRPVLLHAHGYKAGLAAALSAPRRRDTPLVVTFHNMWPEEAGAIERLGLRLIARRAVLVAVSSAIAVSVRGACGIEPTVVGNGIDIERFTGGDGRGVRESLGLTADAPVIGFFGRLTYEKGTELALQVAEQLDARSPGALLLIAGDGPERWLIEYSECQDFCIFLGERDDVPDLMAACDVILIPSRSEGQSLVALEAMAAGRPIVAADVGGLGECVGAAGGLLVPPNDSAALADAVAETIAEPADAARRVASCREWVQRNGNVEVMVERVAELYDRLRSGGG